jgi:HK97 family phage major capsid protein
MAVQLEQQTKGLGLARTMIALARSGGDAVSAVEVAKAHWPESPSVAESLRRKATVPSGTPGTPGYGAELISDSVAQDFIAAVRAATVVDRLQGVRRAPFTVPIPRESTAGFGGAWAGEGSPVPVSNAFLDQVTLPRTHALALAVVTGDLLDNIRPAHELALRDVMLRSVVQYLDQQFLNPSVTASANVRPASITAGAAEITSTGATAAAILNDLKSMLAAVNSDLSAPAWIMCRRDAVHLAGLLTAGGALQFPTVTALGGTLLGIPMLTTSAVPANAGSPATDRHIVLLDAGSVLLADEGRVAVSVSRVTTIEMDSGPTNTGGPSPVASNQTSMYQTHSAAVKTSREISWARAHDEAVAFMRVSY